MNSKLLFAALVMLMSHELNADKLIKNYTPFDLTVRFKRGLKKEISTNLSPNSEYRIDFDFTKVMISGIKTSANAFLGGDEKTVLLQHSTIGLYPYPNVYYVTCEFDAEKSGLIVPLKPQKIRFFLLGAVIYAATQTNGGIYDTSIWFNGVTGLAEKKVSTSETKDSGFWIVRNHTPFTVNVQLKVKNAEGLAEIRSAEIKPNSEYKKEDKNIRLESIVINGIKTIGADNYFGGSQEAKILKQKYAVVSEMFGSWCFGGTTWDIFAQFLDKSAPGLPLSVNPTKVRFVLAHDQNALRSRCRLDGVVNVTRWYDVKTGAAVEGSGQEAK